jgi:hypothetical protein
VGKAVQVEQADASELADDPGSSLMMNKTDMQKTVLGVILGR